MYLGIDLGTSGVKAVLIDEDQTVIGAASAPLTVERPHSGWSEQDPVAWLDATRAALASLGREHGSALAAAAGIGLSGQMHGATLLDDGDRVLRPAILWNDTRSHREAAELDSQTIFRDKTGNIVFPGFTAPKLKWVAANEPQIFDQVAKVLLPKDYLRLWLTGEHISDLSDAAGTAWLDVSKRDWCDELLGACSLNRAHMPALAEGTQQAGRLRADLAGETGLPAGIPVAGGGGDNAASACGIGAVGEGAAFASLGTSGVLFAATGDYRPNPDSAVHTFCHALPGTWHQMGVILSATDALNWYAGLVGEDAATLTGELGKDLIAPGRELFLPYLSGERTPHNDANARGVLLGLGHDSDRAAGTRAVLEGVAFAFRDCLEALKAAGTGLESALAVGGGSASRYWLAALATTLGVPLEVPEKGDFGAAFGAARLGLIAAADADPVSVCTKPAIVEAIEPDAAMADAFERQYQRYRAAYPAVKELF